MGGNTNSNKQKLSKQAVVEGGAEGNEEGLGNDDFNSLVPDAHVDPEASTSLKEFNIIKNKCKKMGLEDVAIRGLKVEQKMGNQCICKVEILCASELGITNCLLLMKELKPTHSFTFIRIMGDNHLNLGTDKIKVGMPAF